MTVFDNISFAGTDSWPDTRKPAPKSGPRWEPGPELRYIDLIMGKWRKELHPAWHNAKPLSIKALKTGMQLRWAPMIMAGWPAVVFDDLVEPTVIDCEVLKKVTYDDAMTSAFEHMN